MYANVSCNAWIFTRQMDGLSHALQYIGAVSIGDRTQGRIFFAQEFSGGMYLQLSYEIPSFLLETFRKHLSLINSR